MFEFLKNMWIFKRINIDYLASMVVKDRISQEEYDEIILIPQI